MPRSTIDEQTAWSASTTFGGCSAAVIVSYTRRGDDNRPPLTTEQRREAGLLDARIALPGNKLP